MVTLFQTGQNLFLSSPATLQTYCRICERCPMPSLASLSDLSVIACPTICLYPVMSWHSKHVLHQFLWLSSWLLVCVCYIFSQLQRRTPPGNSGMWQSLSTISFLLSFVTLLCISSICTWNLMNQLCSCLLNMILGHLQVIHDDWYHYGPWKQIIDSCKLVDTCKSVCLFNSYIINHKTVWSAAEHHCCH